MGKTIVFGKWEAIWLIANMISTKILLSFAHSLVETAGSAAWILSIYLLILANIGFYFISKLFQRFPGKDIFDISLQIGGNWLKILVGIIILLTLVFLDIVYLREFSEEMKIIALTVSPLSYVMIFFVIAITVVCFLGLETLAKLYAISIPILALSFAVVGSMTIPQWDFSNALPVLGLGADKIFITGFLSISIYMELIFLFFLPPFLGSFKEFKSASYTAIIISGLALTVFSLSYVLLFPYPISLENMLPVYPSTRVIDFGRFIQRIEALFMLFWSFTGFLYTSTAAYFTVYTFTRTFNLPHLRPLILPIILLLYNITFLPRSLGETIYNLVTFLYESIWVVTFVMPVLLLITSMILKKRGKQHA